MCLNVERVFNWWSLIKNKKKRLLETNIYIYFQLLKISTWRASSSRNIESLIKRLRKRRNNGICKLTNFFCTLAAWTDKNRESVEFFKCITMKSYGSTSNETLTVLCFYQCLKYSTFLRLLSMNLKGSSCIQRQWVLEHNLFLLKTSASIALLCPFIQIHYSKYLYLNEAQQVLALGSHWKYTFFVK